MKLNRIETALMNNPVRSAVQRRYEAPLLQKLGGRVEGERVIEVGCGRGVGTELILERFGADHVQAFDLDPHMVDLARSRLARFSPDRLSLDAGDVTAIEAEDASADAVFDFAIVHHVPDWQAGVAEIARVLRPGGRFFFEEVTRHALDRWSYRMFLEHPTENRFSGGEWVAELGRQGIEVGHRWVSRFFGDFVIGVGRRAEE